MIYHLLASGNLGIYHIGALLCAVSMVTRVVILIMLWILYVVHCRSAIHVIHVWKICKCYSYWSNCQFIVLCCTCICDFTIVNRLTITESTYLVNLLALVDNSSKYMQYWYTCAFNNNQIDMSTFNVGMYKWQCLN